MCPVKFIRLVERRVDAPTMNLNRIPTLAYPLTAARFPAFAAVCLPVFARVWRFLGSGSSETVSVGAVKGNGVREVCNCLTENQQAEALESLWLT